MPDISCVGILVADIIGKPIEKFPPRGFVELIDSIELHTGGCAVNTGKAMQILGADTAVLGKVGNDIFGEFLIRDLRKYGLNTDGVISDPDTATSSTMVISSADGERSFLHVIGANAAYCYDDLVWKIIEDSKIIHIAGFFVMPGFDGKPAADLLRKVREMGKITALDTVYDATGTWMKKLHETLPYIDYFLPSYEEALQCAGCDEPEKIADFFLEKGVKCIAIKMGEKGSYVANKTMRKQYPAFPVQAVESTGAGDAFVAGFLFGVLKKWDLNTTALFANTVGAMSVTAVGASSGIKPLEETIEQMKQWSTEHGLC